ncbi:MAG: urease accessory protein UreF [Candidatus Binatia bacterium]
MNISAELLLLLQHGDSFFPSGGFAASWGLETLHHEGKITDADSLAQFITGQLSARWASCDRPALVMVYRAGNDLDHIAQVDEELEALALARDMREASRRAGRALLRVHAQLGTPHASAYLGRVKTGQAYGHIPVSQGLVWRGVEMEEEAAVALSGHSLCITFVSAAVRLGIISHIAAQRVLRTSHATLGEILQTPPPSFLSSFTPAADIAMMRHEMQSVRLFAS